MLRVSLYLIASLAILAGAAACQEEPQGTAEPIASETADPAVGASPSPTATATAMPTSKVVASPSPVPTAGPTRIPSPTVAPSATPTVTPSTPTVAPTPTAIPEDLVPVTFKFDAGGVDELDLRLPALRWDLRMPPIRMEKEDGLFTATVLLPRDGLIRYQFQVPGYIYDQREMFDVNREANRMIHIREAMTVSDSVYSWGPGPDVRTEKLRGKVVDAETGEPVIEALVTAEGITAYVSGDGTFEIDVRPGRKHVVAFVANGSYQTDSVFTDQTEVDFALEKAEPAHVVINVDSAPPENHKVRLYTTAEQTGPRFLVGSTILTENWVEVDGRLELDLYEGQFVEYLYTVGNPAVSYENREGQHVIRHFVATDGLVINDTVGSFTGPNDVTLNVTVPDYTGSADVIGVSGVHPTPLYLHRKGDNEWTLRIANYSMDGVSYRYFKSYAGIGDEPQLGRTTVGDETNDVVAAWKYQDGPVPRQELPAPVIDNQFFIFGYPPDFYSAGHALLMESTIDRIAEMGMHGVVLTQVWGYPEVEPLPRIAREAPMPLYTPANEIERTARLAHQRGLKVLLLPQFVGAGHLLGDPSTFGSGWWQEEFRQLLAYNLYNARVAADSGIEYLVFKGREPGYVLPEDLADEYNQAMKDIIAAMREIYSGSIVVPYDYLPGQMDFWRDGDLAIFGTGNGFGVTDEASQAEIDAAVAAALDSSYGPAHEATDARVILNIGYGSADGVLEGAFVPEVDGPHTEAHLNYPLDLEEQQKLYEALYKAVNERDWIAGVTLFGYGLTDAPLSRDLGVRSKPAEEVTRAWAEALEPFE